MIVFYSYLFLREGERAREGALLPAREQGRGRERGSQRIPSGPCAVSAESEVGTVRSVLEIVT